MSKFFVKVVVIGLVSVAAIGSAGAQWVPCDPAIDLGQDAQAYLQRFSTCLSSNTGMIGQWVGEAQAQSLADAERAVELAPESAEAYTARARAHMFNGHFKQALDDFATALRFDPDLPEAHSYRAQLLSRMQDFEASIAEIDQAIELEPENPRWYFVRSSLNQQSGEIETALDDLHQVLSIDPQNAAAYEQIGHLYYDQGSYPEAIQSYLSYLEVATWNVSPVVRARLSILNVDLD